jgi:hypothetical protein
MINETELVLWKEKQNWQILRQTKQKKEKTQINKIRGEKVAGGTVQMVECLPSKCEALNSNPSTTTKKQNKTKS